MHPDKDNTYSWKEIIKMTWYFIGRDKKKYIFWFIILGLVYIYPLVPPLLMGLGLDFLSTYEVGDSVDLFYIIAISYGTSYAFISILRLTAKQHMSYISYRTQYNIRTESFNRLMDFSIKWHDTDGSGNKVQKIIAGSQAIQEFMHQFNSHKGIYKTVIGLLSVLSVFIFLDVKFLIFLILYLFILLFIEYVFYQKIYEANEKINIAAERSSGTYFESTSNVLTVKTLGLKTSISKKINSKEEILKQHSIEESKLGHNKWKYFQVLNGFSYIVFFLLILNGFLLGDITLGFILIYFKYFEDLRGHSTDLTDLISIYSKLKTKIVRLIPLFKGEVKQNSNSKIDFPKNWDFIKLDNVLFSYSKDNKNFNIGTINLTIAKHSKIGIVGHSGSGKSTIAKLMLGVYKIDSGKYQIGDINYYDIDKSQIHQYISTVLQESELFNMSLVENISLMRDIDSKLLKKAIRISQSQSVIDKLPNGLDTMIGEKGYRLSGGERQRIGIARAICQNPDILILDEATSSLDSTTELNIQNSLESELNKKTMIIIAHRLSTLKNVDKIYIFDNGKIIEEGKFDELINDDNSVFSTMYKLQLRQK